MKYKAHIPTEQYGFIEIEGDNRDAVISQYRAVSAVFKDLDNFTPREGHNIRDWARIRNTYAKTNTITPDDLEGCNYSQRNFINELKLVFRSTEKEGE